MKSHKIQILHNITVLPGAVGIKLQNAIIENPKLVNKGSEETLKIFEGETTHALRDVNKK